MNPKYNSATDFDTFAPVYDLDYRNYDDDIPLIQDLAENCGGPVLELGCGTGRVLLPLAAEGVVGTGVDISPSMLTVAKERLRTLGDAHAMALELGDIRNMQLAGKEYAFAYCVSNTLMHCTTQGEQLQVMQNTFNHLRHDGLLLIDLFNPDLAALAEVAGLQELADAWTDDEGDEVLKWSVRTVDTATQIQDTLFIYETISANGECTKRVCPFQLRYIWASEGQLMLEKAGFSVETIWGSFDGEPYHSESERIIFLARKP